MPRKGQKAKSGKDNKQDSRLKALESMVFKTMENKQVNYQATSQSINSNGYEDRRYLKLACGPKDGTLLSSEARIGDSITLLSQQFCMNFIGSSTDTYNQVRCILVESVDGSQDITMSDVLQYPEYSVYGDLVFCSPYTTKTATNKRYKIHMDKYFTLSAFGTKGGVPPTKNIKHKIRWKNGKVVSYDGPSAVNPNDHCMNLLVISDSVSATHVQMSYATRSTYKDA